MYGHPAALAPQGVPGMKQHTELVLVDLMTHLQACKAKTIICDNADDSFLLYTRGTEM